jgi:hypothetical protein
MRLPILPDEASVDLSAVWCPGIRAVVRPPDAGELERVAQVEDSARALHAGVLALVRQQLLRLEDDHGVLCTVGPDDRAFDPSSELDLRRVLPGEVLLHLYATLLEFGRLSPELEQRLRIAVRLQRHDRYGKLQCGSCSEATRDDERCGLEGHEREAYPGMHRLEMGWPRKPELFDRCPWASVADDVEVQKHLNGYWRLKAMNRDVPGRPSAAFEQAFSVIEAEHNRIDGEQIERTQR